MGNVSAIYAEVSGAVPSLRNDIVKVNCSFTWAWEGLTTIKNIGFGTIVPVAVGVGSVPVMVGVEVLVSVSVGVGV